MALGKTTAFQIRAFAIALVVVAGSVTCGPASAQVYWGDRSSGGWGRSGGWGWDNRPSGGWGYPSDRYYRRSPFSGERYHRPAPAVDNSKAPPPRKLETPPSRTIVVIGDSMADWLSYGLDENYADQPEIGVQRKIRATSGLVRYDAKNEALDWPQAAKDALSNEKPNAVVVMLGLNDRLPLREKAPPQPKRSGEPAQGANQSASQASQDKAAAPADAEAPPQTASQTESQRPVPGGSYDFHTDQWAALYAKRIDAMIAALKSKGVPVIWVGLPAIRGTKSTSDLSYLDELYRERAERAGIIYVDIWDGFVDEDGDYAMQGPDFEGQTRRLRTADGVYFTKAGAVKLASYVDRELRRVMPSDVAPVALPGPETTPKSGSASARPDVGPVLPLTASGGEHGGDLLGAGDHPTQTTSDPIAAKVLSRGETLAAPAGRADDFSWRRPGSDATARPEVSPEPVAAAPGSPEKQDTAAKGDGKDQADAKKDAKEKSASNSRASARVPHRYYNYYSGR
ncbi:MAG TPA: GDSL-type esterase/lipase family protein, partial [Xanthobacteraceae bacterium]|nr:GDSL-type esterase/lipase family protein [Xanthobacteraceae bacterium]